MLSTFSIMEKKLKSLTDWLKHLSSSHENVSSTVFNNYTDEKFIEMSYKLILRREPDEDGLNNFMKRLHKNELSRNDFLDILVDSEEFSQQILHHNMGNSIHQSRIRFIKNLPKADRIVDLGGSAQGSDKGALVQMGYPYHFSKLYIIDLPLEERHNLYKNNSLVKDVKTEKGMVEYLYQSMSQLHPIEDKSIDMVYSGQTIEHVTREEASKVYKEVMRVLKPGGHFCLDTPNGRLTRIQQDEFIDPDHEIEYTHEQLSSDLKSAGFIIEQAVGLNYMGPVSKRNEFSPQVLAQNCGLYDVIEDCYILAYRCTKPL